MKIGLQIPSFTWEGGPAKVPQKLAEIARTADEGGFASLWVMDHFFQIPYVGPVENEMLESYSVLMPKVSEIKPLEIFAREIIPELAGL